MKYRHFICRIPWLPFTVATGYHGYRSFRIELQPGLVWLAQVTRSQLVMTTNRPRSVTRPTSVRDPSLISSPASRQLAATSQPTRHLAGEPLGGRQLRSLLLTCYGCVAQLHSRPPARLPSSVTAAPTIRSCGTKMCTAQSGAVRKFQVVARRSLHVTRRPIWMHSRP